MRRRNHHDKRGDDISYSTKQHDYRDLNHGGDDIIAHHNHPVDAPCNDRCLVNYDDRAAGSIHHFDGPYKRADDIKRSRIHVPTIDNPNQYVDGPVIDDGAADDDDTSDDDKLYDAARDIVDHFNDCRKRDINFGLVWLDLVNRLYDAASRVLDNAWGTDHHATRPADDQPDDQPDDDGELWRLLLQPLGALVVRDGNSDVERSLKPLFDAIVARYGLHR